MADRVVSYDFRGDFRNLTAGLAVAGKSVADFGGKLTALDKNGARMRAGLTTLGSAAGKMGLVAAAGLGAAVLASANFDQAMSKVQAATHESAENMELLRAAALKAGADTAFSATEAAAGVEELAKAGVSAADILAGGLSGALDLAAAGGLDVAQAAEISATALTQFSLAGQDVSHVADLLAAGAGKAQGSVSDMGMALKQSGLVAAQTGLSIEETTGTLAAFASAGLIGSDSGTSFKQMLMSLTPTSNKAKSLMNELGISAYDASGNFVGMTEFAASLEQGLAGLSVEQQNAAMKTIFGSDAVRAASVVFEQGADGIQGWIDKTNDAGYAAETAATRMDNLKGDLEALKGSLETALIGAGDGAQGPLRGLVQNMTTLVNALNAIPAPAKNAATSMLAITAVLGGGLWFGAKAVAGVTAMKAALASLGITATGTRAKLALVGTGGAAAALAVGSLMDEISRMDSWTRSKDAADATVKSYQDLADALSYSNVGKYADDLHINLERLSQDLVDNGESGEYVSRVLAQLEGDTQGAGAAFNAFLGEDLPFFTGNTLKSERAMKDLDAIISKAGDNLDGTGDKFEHLGTAMDQAARSQVQQTRITAAQSKALEESRKAARAGAQQFLGLGDSLDDAKVSLGGWIRSLEKQAEALRDFRKNAEQAAKKGLDEGIIKSLNEAGPAGAMRMKQLADASEKEIARVNRASRSMTHELNLTTDAIGGTIGELRKLNAIHLNNKSFDIHVTRSGAGLDFLSGGQRRAQGGYIYGPGTATSDSIPARLSNGEYVVKASAVAKYGVAMMDTINAQRFADGGPVGGRARQQVPDLSSFVGLGQAMKWLEDHANRAGDEFERLGRQIDRELSKRERLLEKELAHAEKRMQAELDELKALKDARRDLVQTTAGNFMSDIFGEGATFTSMLSTLAGDSANASEFEDALAQLSALGLNGGAFAGLAASGNLSAAQDLLAAAFANPQMIAVFEQAFANRALAAQGAGQFAGNEQFGQAIAEQTKEAHAARLEFREAKESLHRVEKRLHHLERLAEKAPKETGREVGDAVNNAAGAAARRR